AQSSTDFQSKQLLGRTLSSWKLMSAGQLREGIFSCRSNPLVVLVITGTELGKKSNTVRINGIEPKKLERAQ
ncbi:hypothetical protein HPP92_027264, partial [Vanilla planifolia]